MPKTIITLHMLAFALVSLAACNSKPRSEHAAAPVSQASSGAPASADAPKSSDLPDPCKILSKAEVESVLGQVYDMQLAADSPDVKECWFTVHVPDDPNPEGFTVRVAQNADASKSILGAATNAKDLWEFFKKGNGEGPKPIPVAGLGDDAYFNPDGAINVLTGHIMLAIDAPRIREKGADGVKYAHDKTLALARDIVAVESGHKPDHSALPAKGQDATPVPTPVETGLSVDPCSFLDQDDAQRLAGIPLKHVPSPVPAPDGLAFACNYEQAGTASGPKVAVLFSVMNFPNEERRNSVWSEAKTAGEVGGGKLDSSEAAGVGDEAFFIRGRKISEAPSTELWVRKGWWLLHLTVNGSKTEPLAAMENVANRIAGTT